MKALTTLATLLFSGMMFAQQAEITNGFDGFETWVSAEAGELPEYWDGFNKNVIFNGMNVGSVTCVEKDSTDPYEGQYSAKMTSTSIMGGPAVPGILTVGEFEVDWNNQDGDVVGGEAYTQLPTILNGQFKFQPVGPDTAFVSVWFMENGVEVGRGRFEFDHSTVDWTEFNVQIDFDLGAAPDSMNIMFSSTKNLTIIPEGTVLEVDAISFQSFVSVSELQKQSLKCYPNPAQDHITVEFEEATSGEVELVNAMGMVVKADTFQGKKLVLQDLDLPTGIYQLIVRTEDTVLNESVVIR
ncbi:MAG: T9SS type A sorting domain-containing protein [Crocinitomicaceae bacterium]